MGDTKIEWATKVWNPVTGCTPVSRGCDHCYAKQMAQRFGHGEVKAGARHCYDGEFQDYRPAKFNEVVFHPDRLDQPLRWRKPQRIFVCSMGDLFHADVPNDWIDKILEVMLACPQHTFILLTKRPENIERKFYEVTEAHPVRELGGGDYVPNLWLGVSVEDQATADERIPILLQTPAALRFVSAEPMLRPVDLTPWLYYGEGCANCGDGSWPPGRCCDEPIIVEDPSLNWVICGGESGPVARPMHPDWARALRDQCQAAGVPFFFKQWGKYVSPLQMPPGTYRAWDVEHGTEGCWDYDDPRWGVGKKAAGRLLDGREWSELPT